MTSRRELLEREYAELPIEPIAIEHSIKNPIEPIAIDRSLDEAVNETLDLMDDPEYKNWFRTQAERLGVDRYRGIASETRQQTYIRTTRGRLFASKLKSA